MEIFGVGLPEIMLIVVVALIVVGPERLPEAARTIGKGIADFRRAIEPARSVWNDISKEITNVANTTTAAITPSLTGSKPNNGNPYPIHPVLAMMTEQERENFIAGGEMPPHVAAKMAADVETPPAASYGNMIREAVELPHLDYAMPHSEMVYKPAPPLAEDLYYPSPDESDESDESKVKS